MECECSKSTIRSVIQRHGNESITGATPTPPKHKTIPERDKRSLIRIVNKNPRAPLIQITKQLPEKISVWTLQRRLKEVGIQKYIAVKKLYLSPVHIQAWLKWAMKQKDWTINDWCKVIFSNESKIEIGCNSRPIWVFGTEVKKYRKEYLTFF